METLVVADNHMNPLAAVPLHDRELVTIGRSTRRDVIVNDPAISRFHCVIYREGDTWCIADTGSSAGTWIDGRRTRWKRLISGRFAEIGHLTLWIEGEPATPTSAILSGRLDLAALVEAEESDLEQTIIPDSQPPSGRPGTSSFLDNEDEPLPMGP